VKQWWHEARGQSLVEVVVAGAILSLVAGTLTVAFRGAAQSNVKARRIDQAGAIAQAMLEDRRHAIGVVPFQSGGPVADRGDFSFTAEGQFYAGRADLAQIAVKVWPVADPQAAVAYTAVVRIAP
jgi:type II secretory pathway pseudopilin PulG